MKPGVNRKFALFMCLACVFLTGCWDQKIFERIGFILQLGLELDEEGKLLYSITQPVVSEEIEQNVEVLSTTKDLLRESREYVRNLAGKRVEGGKIQHLHFSKELAEKGIADLLDVFLRSPENPLLANIIVVDGSPLEMFKLSLEYKDKPRVAEYVTQLVDDARKRTATPETRIFKFVTLTHVETIDPIATYMGYTDKQIQIKGTALFNGEKMVGEIGTNETGVLHTLMGEKISFDYYYRDSQEQNNTEKVKKGAALLLKGAKRKVTIDVAEGVPSVSIELDIKSSLDEYEMDKNLEEDKVKKDLEDKVSQQIKRDCEKLIQYLQKVKADPLGIAEMVRSKHSQYYQSIQWDEVYPKITFQVDVKINIEFYGAVH